MKQASTPYTDVVALYTALEELAFREHLRTKVNSILSVDDVKIAVSPAVQASGDGKVFVSF